MNVPAPRPGVLALAALLLAQAALAAPARERSAVPVTVLAVTSATATDGKMDAALRSVVDVVRARTAAGAAARPLPAAPEFFAAGQPWRLFDAGPGREPLAPVFVRLAPGADAHALVPAGGEFVRQDGDLAILRLPVSTIEPVVAGDGVRAMSLARQWSADLDSSRVRTKVSKVQAGAGGLSRAYLGDGVIVGVLDSGIDYTHADFKDNAGHTRLKALYDFAQGTDGQAYGPGALDSTTCPEIDGTGAEGHGTHVTGIAAGGGKRNAAYTGMAPDADIVFVKGMRSQQSTGGFSSDDIVAGVGWIMDNANALGEPVVVNMSLGGTLGPHDGTAAEDVYLDHFTGPGRIICVAAGNSGQDSIHVGYTDAGGTDYGSAYETGIVLTSSTGGLIDLWSPAGSNLGIGVAAYDPVAVAGGDWTHPLFVSNAATPGQLVQGNATNGSTTLGAVTIDARTTADAGNGDRNVVIKILPTGSADPSSYLWSLYTYGTGHFDAWSNGARLYIPGQLGTPPAWFVSGDANLTVGSPGDAKKVICVGSHISKINWKASDGNTYHNLYPRTAALDSISTFSSHGPSRDGRILPSVTAPGDVIVSVLSKDNTTMPAALIAFGGGYEVLQGTSQATPHVTGIVALMLQRDPALSPENARQILAQTAIATDHPVPSNTYGAGRVDALAALLATPDPLGCFTIMPDGRAVPCATAAALPLSLMAYPNPATKQVRLAFTLPAPQRVHLAMYDLSGRRVRTLLDGALPAGQQVQAWAGEDERGRALPGGVYFARLITADGTRSIRFVLSR